MLNNLSRVICIMHSNALNVGLDPMFVHYALLCLALVKKVNC